MKKAMCKINSFNIEKNKPIQGSGFFIKIKKDLCGLLTNHHFIYNIHKNNIININYLSKEISNK